MLKWFRATGEDIRLEPRKERTVEWSDGWSVEVGNDRLGCQEIGDDYSGPTKGQFVGK